MSYKCHDDKPNHESPSSDLQCPVTTNLPPMAILRSIEPLYRLKVISWGFHRLSLPGWKTPLAFTDLLTYGA